MKICLQAPALPGAWEEFDSEFWNDIPWTEFNACCVQGMQMSGYDRLVVETRTDGGCRVKQWKDDGSIAMVVEFPPYAPDSLLNGAINTRQQKTVYADSTMLGKLQAEGPVERILLPIGDFAIPSGKSLKGILLTDELEDALFHARFDVEGYGWRDWGETGLGGGEPVPPQRPLGRYRKFGGTMTFFFYNNVLVNNIDGATDQGASAQVADTGTNTEIVAAGTDEVIMVWTSPIGEPGQAWPTDVNGSLSIDTIGADVSAGFRNTGSAVGHVGRVNTGLTAHVDTKQMAESLWTSTGIKSYTVSGAWSAGDDANDRVEAVIGATRVVSMGSQGVRVDTNPDSYVSGAWEVPAGAGPPPGSLPLMGVGR